MSNELNFNEANIADIRRAWAEEMANDPEGKNWEHWTMIEHSNGCGELNITEASMRECARMLIQ
jgi:hypothetical protein